MIAPLDKEIVSFLFFSKLKKQEILKSPENPLILYELPISFPDISTIFYYHMSEINYNILYNQEDINNLMVSNNLFKIITLNQNKLLNNRFAKSSLQVEINNTPLSQMLTTEIVTNFIIPKQVEKVLPILSIIFIKNRKK